ncbi:MAG: type II secretion system F family protein [Candidatus Melainabacteria bacterium]|nr:type II secretion system F family protein [Candidatus Melainabacteria bacterium]
MTNLMIILSSVCAFGAIFLICIVIYRTRAISAESSEISKRLQFWLSEKSESAKYTPDTQDKEDKDESFAKRVLIPLGEQVGSWFSEKVPYSKQSAARKLLIKAGFRDKKALQFLYTIKITLAIVLAVIPFFILSVIGKNLQTGMFLAFIVGAVGFIFPNIFLDKLVAKRQQSIDRILPDALDLLVICTEAGMGIDQSLLRVASNIGNKGKDLAEEIILTNREMNLGQDRTTCWLNLGTRTSSEELKSLARIIIQSEKVGSSIGGVLRSQANFLRVRRRQKAEETAAQMTIKMMLPMALFIFPCVLAVSVGPPVLQLISTLGSGLPQ